MLPTREKRERMLAWRLAWDEGAGLDLSEGGGPPGDDKAEDCCGTTFPQASLALLLLLCISTCT